MSKIRLGISIGDVSGVGLEIIIKTFKDFSVDKDPTNNCLDTAIITDPKLRTKKTIKKLKYIAGRALNKKSVSYTHLTLPTKA